MTYPSDGGGSTVDERSISDSSVLLRGRFGGDHILVPILTAEAPAVTDQVKIASTLSRGTGATVSVVNPISVPDQTPKTLGDQIPDDRDEALLEWALDQSVESTPQVNGGFIYTRDIVRGLLQTVRNRDIDTLVLPSASQGGRFRTGLIERIAVHVDCDVVVVNGQAGYHEVPSVLVPVAGGPNAGLSADIAQSIAADCDAWIDILHVIEGEATDRRRTEAREIVDSAYHRIARPEATSTWVFEAENAAAAIIEQSRYYGLTIIGAPTKGRLRRFIYGSTNRTIRSDARSVVLSVRNNRVDAAEA